MHVAVGRVPANKTLKLTGAAILVSRDVKSFEAALAAVGSVRFAVLGRSAYLYGAQVHFQGFVLMVATNH